MIKRKKSQLYLQALMKIISDRTENVLSKEAIFSSTHMSLQEAMT